MTSSPLRIVMIDPVLAKTLETLKSEATFETCKASELGSFLGKADIFLLDDDNSNLKLDLKKGTFSCLSLSMHFQ